MLFDLKQLMSSKHVVGSIGRVYNHDLKICRNLRQR